MATMETLYEYDGDFESAEEFNNCQEPYSYYFKFNGKKYVKFEDEESEEWYYGIIVNSYDKEDGDIEFTDAQGTFYVRPEWQLPEDLKLN